jgi:hypothetical protein
MRTWRTCSAWSGSPAAPRGRGDAVTAAARGRRACEERCVVTTSRRETGVFFHELIVKFISPVDRPGFGGLPLRYTACQMHFWPKRENSPQCRLGSTGGGIWAAFHGNTRVAKRGRRGFEPRPPHRWISPCY